MAWEASTALRSLADHLHVLASPSRLEVLRVLRTPKPLANIRIHPARSSEAVRDSRPLSRQAVSHHLQQLVEFGLVRTLEDPAFPRDVGYVVNPERLFAVIDELRTLTQIVPNVDPQMNGQTMVMDGRRPRDLPPRPLLLVTYGPQDWTAFPLNGNVGERWIIGRCAECDIRLPYDPYLSARNSELEFTDEGPAVRDLGGRNGTLINFDSIGGQEHRRLRPGDVLTVGRTRLVYQA